MNEKLKLNTFFIVVLFSFLTIAIGGCASFGEGMKSVVNPGYNSWSIEYDGSFSNVSPSLIEILQDLEFEIESRSTSKIETEYRLGPARYDGGGFFAALDKMSARDGMIKLSIEHRENEGKSYLFLRTFTQLENRRSSYSRSKKSNPEWSLWEDELMFISEQIKNRVGTREEMGKYFVRSAGDARIN